MYEEIFPETYLIGEHGIRLDELLWESVREALEDVAAHAGAGAARDRVRQHEPLEGVGALRLAVDDVEDLLVQLPALIEVRAQSSFGNFGFIQFILDFTQDDKKLEYSLGRQL